MHQKKYIYKICYVVLIVLSFLFLITKNIQPQSSENYQLKKSAISQGGARSQSTIYQILDSIGQSAVVCTTASENYILFSGFLYGYGVSASGVDKSPVKTLPDKFQLFQNVPNPFNPETTISFSLPKDSHVEIAIYNIYGQQISSLLNQEIQAGIHKVKWDGTNHFGSIVSSGIYIVYLSTQDYRESIKTILLK